MRKSRGFILITTILIVIAAFSITGTVKSQSKDNMKLDEKYYRQMEQEYVREVRNYLAEQGFENSGVMLTYVSGGSDARTYTITIHNEKLKGLPEAKKAAIRREILDLAFEAPECTFFGEFLSV
ncbi:MAG: hypothetical protein IJ282_08155 [Lachnospiraceae bacterium]|nr:hypothetical protein [Lachnospiraceae bacterium]